MRRGNASRTSVLLRSPDDQQEARSIVAIHAELTVRDDRTGKVEPRSLDSSWISTLEKIDGAWKTVAIASNVNDN